MAQPLNDLLRKDKKFEWTPSQQHAFDTLKTRFTEHCETRTMAIDNEKHCDVRITMYKVAFQAVGINHVFGRKKFQ